MTGKDAEIQPKGLLKGPSKSGSWHTESLNKAYLLNASILV